MCEENIMVNCDMRTGTFWFACLTDNSNEKLIFQVFLPSLCNFKSECRPLKPQANPNSTMDTSSTPLTEISPMGLPCLP